MCGIVGVIGSENAALQVLEGLKRLEYRGYDSAGIAQYTNGESEIRRSVGKISALEETLQKQPFSKDARIAIGHTRWATHGAPTEVNAHPHKNGRCTVVHNGIIENYQALRERLSKEGFSFTSQTDTETIPALIAYHLGKGKDLPAAMRATLAELEGAFAFTVMTDNTGDTIYAARRGAPLVIGRGNGANFVGSDPLALAPYTNQFIFLEEDDIAEITSDNVRIFTQEGQEVIRAQKVIDLSAALVGKAGYPHFMLKEIHEQGDVVSRMLEHYLRDETVKLPQLPYALTEVPQINVVACGTAYYASMVGKYLLEQAGDVPVNVDTASEFRYRKPPLKEGGVFIAVSQSGETADTLAALEYAKSRGQYIITLTNTLTSSIARASDTVIGFHAGAEIAVASTKCFTGMLTAFALLAVKMAEEAKTDTENYGAMVHALRTLPAKINQTLSKTEAIEKLAAQIKNASSMLYLGRGQLYPIACEGALKIKEISYIHAEGYASGEMKHGPIALVDEKLPVVNLASSTDGLLEKTISNMQEINARHGQVILVGDKEALKAAPEVARTELEIPSVHPLVAPIIFTLPLQLLAYHVAVLKGTDVDQPRNLAKSVTVE